MRRVLVLVSAMALLSACERQSGPVTPGGNTASGSTATDTGVAPSAPAADRAAQTEAAQPGTPMQSDIPPAPDETAPPLSTGAPLLAFDFRYSMGLPSARVRPLMDSHQEACERAGPTQCQVMNVQSRDDEHGLASGELTLRATPAWLHLFRARVEADVHDAGGRIVNAGTQGQDVAQVIQQAADQDNALSEQRAALLRRLARGGDEAEDLRQQIAVLDQQITQARDSRTNAQERAAMATVVLDYRANGLVPASGDAAPLAEATRHFWANSAEVAAWLVNIASVLTPFALIGAPIWWLVLRYRRRPASPPRPASVGEEVSAGS
jgi:hypothetical protein